MSRNILLRTLERGVEQLVARQAHNLEVVRSSRTSATINILFIVIKLKSSRLQLDFF